jgi:hypothetical protein
MVLLGKEALCNITRELVVTVEKCEFGTRVAALGVSYKLGVLVFGTMKKKKRREDWTHRNETCELFLKPPQLFCEGFVCTFVLPHCRGSGDSLV